MTIKIYCDEEFPPRRVEAEYSSEDDAYYIRLYVHGVHQDAIDCVVYGVWFQCDVNDIAEHMLQNGEKPDWATPAFDMPVL